MVVKGLDKIENWLSRDIDIAVDNVLNDWAKDVVNKASNRAIKDVKNDFKYEVTKSGDSFVITLQNTNILGAYSEFGTGGQVFVSTAYNFTPEDQEYASNFIRTKKGKLKPTPALYPSVFENIQRLAVELASEINGVFR